MKDITRFLLTVFLFCLLITGTSCISSQPGEPVMVLTTERDFGFYTTELLKAEGFNEFMSDSLSNPELSARYLDQFRLIILPAQVVSGNQKMLLEEYVREGGRLIAFSPDIH